MKLKNQEWLSFLKRKEKVSRKFSPPKFKIWLTKQIYSGNKHFSLESQDLILCNPLSSLECIFILPEVIDQYHKETGIGVEIIKSELKKALQVTFDFKILRDGKMIIVFPVRII